MCSVSCRKIFDFKTAEMMILLLLVTIVLNCVVVNAHRYAVHDHPVHPYFDEELKEETAEARHRRLSTFVPIETRFTDQAYESTIGNLRVKFVWDLLDDAIQDTTTTQAEQMDPSVCREVGQTVDVCRYERSFGSSCSQSCQSLTCTQSDVLTAEKLSIAKEHAQWAADYLSESLFVTKVESPIDFSGEDSAKRCYNWDKGNSSLNTNSSFIHSATDVVVVMTMHKAPDGVAGYLSLCFSLTHSLSLSLTHTHTHIHTYAGTLVVECTMVRLDVWSDISIGVRIKSMSTTRKTQMLFRTNARRFFMNYFTYLGVVVVPCLSTTQERELRVAICRTAT